jgi:hypothetical protein
MIIKGRYIKNKKLKSFTVIELVVARLASGIVISLVISSYSLIERSIIRSTEEYEFDNHLMTFFSSIKQDFDKAVTISGAGNKLRIAFKDKSEVRYSFGDTISIREVNELVDSFLFKPVDLQITNLKGNQELVEEISFMVKHKKLDYPFHFCKDYSCDQLFQIDHNQ